MMGSQVQINENKDKVIDIEEETCLCCGKSLPHTGFVNHLFASRDCMRKYWEDEEKTHAVRMRHRGRFNKNQKNMDLAARKSAHESSPPQKGNGLKTRSVTW